MEKGNRRHGHAAGSSVAGPGVGDERLADLADLIVNVARKVRTHGHDDDRVIRLTMTESAVMRHIGGHPGTTPSEAARATGIQRSNLSAALRELEAKGLVRLDRDERDGRGVRLHATPLADANLALLRADWAEQLRAALPDDADIDACVRLLRRLEDGLVAARRRDHHE